MNALEPKSWQRRLKSKKKWPRWLRNSYLLRMAVVTGVLLYRLWRLLRALVDLFGS